MGIDTEEDTKFPTEEDIKKLNEELQVKEQLKVRQNKTDLDIKIEDLTQPHRE